jgi:hypothetical protein
MYMAFFGGPGFRYILKDQTCKVSGGNLNFSGGILVVGQSIIRAGGNAQWKYPHLAGAQNHLFSGFQTSVPYEGYHCLMCDGFVNCYGLSHTQ